MISVRFGSVPLYLVVIFCDVVTNCQRLLSAYYVVYEPEERLEADERGIVSKFRISLELFLEIVRAL